MQPNAPIFAVPPSSAPVLRTTATKAVAGGVGGALVIVANWLLTLIPGWSEIPDEPRGALTFLVSVGIAAGMVYLAPPNREVAR